MNDPFILSAISAAITPAVTAWPVPGGGAGGGGSPLTSAAISSIAGNQTEGSTIIIYSSWVGGTAPFKVQYSSGDTFNGVTGNSHSVNTTVVAGVAAYNVTVTDALGVVKVSTNYSFPSLYVRAGSASYSFNTANKTATFYANPSGNPYPSIAWYVSVNGGAYQYWSSSSVWTSGAYGPQTTVYAYYVASNSSGSVTSNTTGGGYQ